MSNLPGFRKYFMADDGGGAGGGAPAAAAAPAAGSEPAAGGTPAGGAPAAGADGSKPAGADGGQQWTLPDAYKDKPWAKDFKSQEDVFKSLESAQALIGRPKFGVPNDKATPEERAAFFKELGVPDDAKGYGFKKPDNVPDDQWDTKGEEKWAGLMKQHNVPAPVANALRDEMIKETLELHANTTKTLNDAMDKVFGDQKTAVGKEVGEYMKKAIPDAALRAQIEKNVGSKETPAFALALGQVVQYFKKTYGLADTNSGDGGDGTGGKSIKEMRAEATKMMSSEAYTNTMHKDHAETRKSVDQMYKDIGRLTDAAKTK